MAQVKGIVDSMDNLSISLSELEVDLRRYFRGNPEEFSKAKELLERVSEMRNIATNIQNGIDSEFICVHSEQSQPQSSQSQQPQTQQPQAPTKSNNIDFGTHNIEQYKGKPRYEIFTHRGRKVRNVINAVFDFKDCEVKILRGSEFKIYSSLKWIENVKRNDGIKSVLEYINNVAETAVSRDCQDMFNISDYQAIESFVKEGKAPVAKLKSTLVDKHGKTIVMDHKGLSIYEVKRLREDSEWLDMYDVLRVVVNARSNYTKDWRSIVDGDTLRNRLGYFGLLKPHRSDVIKVYI